MAGNPWLFGGELAPLSDLIDDPNKKASMERAVQVHLDRAYLNDVISKYYTMLAKTHDSNIEQQIQGKIQQLTALVTDPKLPHTAVTALLKKTEAPDWFLNTKFCLQWKGFNDKSPVDQCGGPGLPHKVCAPVNSMTQAYRDHSDDRGTMIGLPIFNGCYLSWGITSTGQEDWFNQVQICYRWQPHGGDGQCGTPGLGRNLCATVGKFTQNYADRTSSRRGGCRMSWSLQVPTTAPLWMQAARLCFSWSPDGDAGQCGGGVARNLCAVANTWTPYYLDDTDRRSGGCLMSWGIKIR